ncbi:hypothetical protein Z946_790 [Sulfitobacter noctilucicola]|nr:hypothetical protein Z946_790 [Sulfitobacter noctilucicola]
MQITLAMKTRKVHFALSKKSSYIDGQELTYGSAANVWTHGTDLATGCDGAIVRGCPRE